MKRKRRLSIGEHLEFKEFKKEVREERKGKIFKDHAGHLYRTDENGSVRRLTGDDLRVFLEESSRSKGPAIS